MSQPLKILIKSLCVLNVVFISPSVLAERDLNVSEVCARFKVAAAKASADKVTFKYYAGPPQPIYRTYYKGSGSEYYEISNGKRDQKVTLIPRGDIYAKPLKNVLIREYQAFFSACNLSSEEEFLSLGFMLLEAQEDPVTAAKALEDSEWFEIVYPMFYLKP